MGKWRGNVSTLLCATLGGSCCLVQLLLNALGFGCAGFAVLTPYRSVFSGMALILLVTNMSKRRFRWNALLLFATVLSIFLPELVATWNSTASISSTVETRSLRVSNIKCAACLSDALSRIKQVSGVLEVTGKLSQVPGVAEITVWVSGASTGLTLNISDVLKSRDSVLLSME